MRPDSTEFRAQLWWKRVLLVGTSLVLAYVIAFLTLMIRWLNFWIRDSYSVAYQLIFLTMLMILLLFWLRRYHNGQPPVLSTFMFSVVAGYAAGLLALALHPIFQKDGLQQVLLSLKFPAPEAAFAFFWFPIKLLNWLFGGIAGLIMVVMSRRVGSLSPERPAS